MVLKRLVVSVVVLFMARPVLAEGGAESGPVVGVRVRVTTTSERLVGKWIAGDGNKLRIEVKPGKEVAIRLSEVTTLEESRRKGRRGAGAMLGFAVGAAAGAVHAARSRAPVCQGTTAMSPFVPHRTTTRSKRGESFSSGAWVRCWERR